MKSFNKFIFFSLLLFSEHSFCNDGAFYTSGNQLIPIEETIITIKKEVLTITRINDDYVKIDVEYNFFNPGNNKKLLIGFEAHSPSGDANGTPINGGHPYIFDFNVNMNDSGIPFKIAMVTDSIYFQNGILLEKKESSLITNDFNPNQPLFNYVYYFNANFKKGLNKINHHYTYKMSGSVSSYFSIDYILSTAKRWANKQIDDFTLIIDLGEFQDYIIYNSFFYNAEDWDVNGITVDTNINDFSDYKINPYSRAYYSNLEPQPVTHFYVKNGPIIFKKFNFKPTGELKIDSPVREFENDKFDYKKHILDYSYEKSQHLTSSDNEISFKILRNLPYARRGYIFKTPEIKEYYENLEWYQPDVTYKVSLNDLTPKEQEWLEKVKRGYLKK